MEESVSLTKSSKKNPFLKEKSCIGVENAKDILNKVEGLNEILDDKSSTLEEKIDSLIKMYQVIFQQLMIELVSPVPDETRSLVASRAGQMLRDIQGSLVKIRELNEVDEINPHSTKFQMIFGWFIEILHEVMEEQKVDDILIDNVFNSLSQRLVGWEDVILKKVHSLSGKAGQGVENPFLTEFKEKLKK